MGVQNNCRLSRVSVRRVRLASASARTPFKARCSVKPAQSSGLCFSIWRRSMSIKSNFSAKEKYSLSRR